ncbi:MAG: hypothetical protein K9M44_03665 [Candidatus Pacebacteria bacterium]|nr:hypothetical protein [Candidatus Paceibacterota bacterium]
MPKLNHKLYRIWLFIVGIIATIAYRIIIVLNYYSPVAVEIAWYIGTIGFVWYFIHRYKVENRRDHLIESMRLAEKIANKEELKDKERQALVYILKGLKTSLAKWNYIAIFLLSALALAYGIYSDFLSLLVK